MHILKTGTQITDHKAKSRANQTLKEFHLRIELREDWLLSPDLWNTFSDNVLGKLNESSQSSSYDAKKKQVSKLHMADNSTEGEKSSMSFQGVIICTRELYEEWKLKINTAMTKKVAFMKGGKFSRNHRTKVTNNYNTYMQFWMFSTFSMH